MLLIILNLEDNLIVKKLDHLVYMINVLKASLKVLCLVLLKIFLNAVHLEYLSDIQKE